MAVLTANKTLIKGNYSIEIEERFSKCDQGKPSYKVTCTDITTNQINEEMSDTIYLSMNAVNEFINSIEEVQVVEESKQITTETKQQPAQKKVTITDNIPQVEMIANYANILFKGSYVEVVFTGKETITATFKYRRSWSNKKYIDTVFNKTSIKPSWDFRYGWERVGA